MKVIVGLGNPGREYARTRHNVGWMVLDALAPRLGGGSFRPERPLEVCEASWRGEKMYLLKPQTYMNLSGQALASWFGRFREIREAVRKQPESPVRRPRPGVAGGESRSDEEECVWPGLLVVSDDVNLPLGRLRIRPSGSAGGHNGLKDIEKTLGGRGYPRLRLGVGAPPERMDRADYVLGKFAPEEMTETERMVDKAAAAVVDWLEQGLEAVRNRYNGQAPAGEQGG